MFLVACRNDRSESVLLMLVAALGKLIYITTCLRCVHVFIQHRHILLYWMLTVLSSSGGKLNQQCGT